MSTDNSLQSTFKSSDTEETIDIYFTRPIGLAWAKFFNLFGTHPNVITILSILLGAAAGALWLSAKVRGGTLLWVSPC